MTIRWLRRVAFIIALVMSATAAVVLLVYLVLDGPSPTAGTMLAGVFTVLLALAGIRPWR